MKNNQPVTANEIPFPRERYLVSKTDLSGVITYANDEFVRMSGFSHEELIGQSHNIVRHPDMPVQAFADLWATVKRGDPWHGMVKNRAKNGDFYWVDAFVVPVKKDGRVTGYMSVRSEPTRQQIAAAEKLYQRINQSAAPFPSLARKEFGLLSRMAANSAIACVLMAMIGLVGFRGMQIGNQHLNDAYDRHFAPAFAMQETLGLMGEAYQHALLGAEHGPAGRAGEQPDHTISRHTGVIEEDVQEIMALREMISTLPLQQEHKPLLEAFDRATVDFIENGLKPAMDSLRTGQYDHAAMIAENRLYQQYENAKAKAGALRTHILDAADARKQSNRQEYLHAIYLTTGILIGGLLLLLAISRVQAQRISRQMEQVVNEFDYISEGVMTRDIDIHGSNEFGRMNKSLAIMQTNVKIMLDNIREAVMTLQQKSSDLDAQMYVVLMQSRNQQAEVEGMSVTTDRFSQSVSEVAKRANAAAIIATNSQQLVTACNTTMSQSMAANARVVHTVNDSSNIITELNQSIQRIGEVTTTIRAIADQTNLLALNAAIEAARAGEAGRGFAVVADEVRQLAESTANSTSDITNLVAEIHRIAETAVNAMRQAVREVDDGVGKMRESVDGLDQITAASSEVSTMANEISSEAGAQAEAGIHVSSSMMEVARTVEQNTHIAQQSSELSRDLLQVAERMKTLMEEFQLFEYGAPEKSANATGHSSTSAASGSVELF